MQVCHNVTFLVDLHALGDPMDVRADENGVWDRKGSPVAYVSIHKNGGTTAVYKHSLMGSHSSHHKITRVYILSAFILSRLHKGNNYSER